MLGAHEFRVCAALGMKYQAQGSGLGVLGLGFGLCGLRFWV